MQQEPLLTLFKKYKYNLSEVKKFVQGKRYIAVMLTNGNIGVCATLQNEFLKNKELPEKPDLTNPAHRIFVAAYFNAKLNYANYSTQNTNIVDVILKSNHKKVVMIGHFEPIEIKLQQSGVKVSVFDYLKSSIKIISQEKQKEFLQSSKAVILTATSIYNDTFLKITKNTPANSEIYLLGPSSLMHPEIFKYQNLKAAFGTIFKNNDTEILKIIEQGQGTRNFIKFAQKAVIWK